MKPLENTLYNMEIGELASYGRIDVVPVVSRLIPSLQYLTLPEIRKNSNIRISETSDGGQVEELSLVNPTDDYILLLDGEELAGAKQNRVINTSIMAAPKSSLRLPVSCTEEGRWSYNSTTFEDSDNVMPLRARYNKKSSVDFSLKSSGNYRSNQSQVWDDISTVRSALDSESPTGAMRDVYFDRASKLEEFVEAFRPGEGQTGMVVLVDNVVVTMELFSNASALQALYPKLIKSYGMQVLVEDNPNAEIHNAYSLTDFMESIQTLDSRGYKSVGEGWDHRFNGHSVTGSALVCGEEVIHAVFYNEKNAGRPTKVPQ